MNLSNQGKTAILIFANSSTEELKHKPIVNGQKLFDTLTNNTVKTVKKTKLPYFHFTEKEQMGASFGARFSNAIQEIIAKGYENIIAIGNDTPKLTAATILKAEKELNENKVVLGPSIDGGFYLIGLKKEHFQFDLFENLPWQTPNIRKSVVLAATSNQEYQVSLLPYLLDLDFQEDLRQALNFNFLLPNNLVKIILQILQSIQVYSSSVLLISANFLHRNYFNKGSPVVFQS
tara:strand:- start:177 stop:875 length:699 start_codon:yes stop_codon:yes gene_type:complete